ncbi:LysR family transcriptional regulator [Labrys miyagiensis]|uniref:LysR family transcriptional regulator n=1 Tax=Labrys miyagiensis TaxID=346912 RepID=A0ABQ6CTY3_9HYPH|nr:LysR family transcriptional regulator [Labrys miyagiensis]GLS23585.1 LysR family transcriptional regulator [Labrys miyagiensis]
MPLINIDLRHLRAFAGVAAERNFMRAADRLHVSQPALSQTIRQLELRFGVRLFERTTHRVALTEEGAVLLKDTEEILQRIEALVVSAQDLAAGRQGTLRVGYLIGAAVDLVPNILRSFSEQFPLVNLALREFDFSMPEAGLADGSIDVAIIRPPIEDIGATCIPLLEEPCVACLPSAHRLAQAGSVSVYDLLDEPIVAAPGRGIWRDYWTANAYRQGRPPNIVYEAATFEGELQAVATGRGISITAEAARRFYARPGVSFVPIADMPPCPVAVALPKAPTMLARSFAATAVAVVAGDMTAG